VARGGGAHLGLQRAWHRQVIGLLKCVAAQQERLDCRVDGLGRSFNTHGTQEVFMKLAQMRSDQIAATDAGLG
jgi:hypothetical protein